MMPGWQPSAAEITAQNRTLTKVELGVQGFALIWCATHHLWLIWVAGEAWILSMYVRHWLRRSLR